TPLWTKSLKASLLREGVHTYYIVTRCGLAGVDVGLISKPIITDSPKTIFKGDTITIKGRNFMDYSPEHLLRVIVAEPGMDHPIKVLEWSDTEITALATFDTEYGRHELVVDKGLNANLHRRSTGKPITVVKRDTFPPVMISAAIEDAFSGLKIRLNTYTPSPEGTYFDPEDSYIEPSSGMALAGEERVNLEIPEYDLAPPATDAGTEGKDKITGP
ncbi:MAG: hypothetical protein GY771_00710, partial [bacterium]|nr:hypothetical protein [bacterium]